MKRSDIKFGVQISAVEAEGATDEQLYDALRADAIKWHSLGYEAAWVVEHHFSDYFPHPSPFGLLSYLAGVCPGMGLGAMVVVTPWHQPVRLAGEIAQLSHLASGPLYIGLGRGNAPMEYDAFGVPMEEAKQRFEECWQILQRAIVEGGRFTYEGQHLSVTREIEVRPRPKTEKINFYGAIGSPPSAEKIAKLGLSPLFSGGLPLKVLSSAVDTWEKSAAEEGLPTDVARPIAIPMILADTDEKAHELARKCVARWFDVQVKHYAHDASRHRDIPDYKPFAEMHQRRVFFTDPNNLDPFIDVCLVGSPSTICEKLDRYIAMGFNHIILMTALPDVPDALRTEWLTRFAKEVAPRYAPKYQSRAAE